MGCGGLSGVGWAVQGEAGRWGGLLVTQLAQVYGVLDAKAEVRGAWDFRLQARGEAGQDGNG